MTDEMHEQCLTVYSVEDYPKNEGDDRLSSWANAQISAKLVSGIAVALFWRILEACDLPSAIAQPPERFGEANSCRPTSALKHLS